MTPALLVAAAGALVASPGVTDHFGRRLAPGEWSRLCAVGLAGGLTLFELAVTLRAAPALLRAAGVPWLATACAALREVLRMTPAASPHPTADSPPTLWSGPWRAQTGAP